MLHVTRVVGLDLKYRSATRAIPLLVAGALQVALSAGSLRCLSLPVPVT